MRLALAMLAAFAAGAATAQDRPAEQPYAAAIETDGAASHYRFALPAEAYRGAARRDLGDLRVFNAAGEPVPYAFAPRNVEAPPPALQAANLFPLYGERGQALDAASIRVERNARGTVVNVSIAAPRAPATATKALLGYLVDLSELKAPRQALLLAWETRESFSGLARVEGSDDLKQWWSAGSAPVLFLEHNGARLERRRIELPGATAKYLRVSFDGVPRDFALKAVQVELRRERPEPVREWLSLAGTPGKERGELIYESGGHFPVDRLRLALPQPNTVAEVRFFSRGRSEEPWRPVATATAYRLAGNGGAEIVNPEIVIAPDVDRQWLLRVDQKGGGFGSGEVRLELGWVPHEVVFAARGTAPFVLAYGNRGAKPGALPISSVLPRRDGDELAPARHAKLGAVSGVSPATPSLLGDPVRFLRSVADDRDAKKWLLWAALVAGVLFLAFMAFRLLRELGKPGVK